MNIGSTAVFRIVSTTLPYLREGLSYRTATAATQAIYDVVGVSAVAISDRQRILAFIGEGADHHRVGMPILTHLTRETLNTGLVQAVQGIEAIGCAVETCPLHSALVAPLRAHDQIIGCLKFYHVMDVAFSERELEFAQGLAQMLSLELELAEINIQKQLATEAELQALQAQISPHFLFNTLNTIAASCRLDGAHAEDLIVEFAELFRRNLRHHRGLVSLQEELDFVDSYLRFEQYRFGERLRVERDHPPQAMSVRVPPLVLQPIVENAVEHVVSQRMGTSTILIQSHFRGDDLILAVQDDGPGLDPAALDHDGEGIGMRNVQRRLLGLYGIGYGLTISNPIEGGTRIEMRVPRRAPERANSLTGGRGEAA